MWRLRIEQYFQVQDYTLWDAIENRNSFKPVPQTITNADGSSTSLIPGHVTTEEKVQKKNDVKARSMLLMALLNEHLINFNKYKDAQTLLASIQTRFGGNEATKKTLLKQMNKPDLDTMSFNDLYNNFKIVEQEVKGTASSSSQNMAFVSSPNSTNEVNTAYGFSTANTQVSPASAQVSTASTQDLENIHEYDIEVMDLKWQLALLSMRTKKFFQKTGRKITSNRSDTAGYDKGHRNQDRRNKNQDNSRRTINVEETFSKAMVVIDGDGFDWSYIADDEVPTNMALMAFLDSEFNKSEFNLTTYKRRLASVEEQLVFYKKNEVIFCKQLAVIKRDISYKDSELSMLKSELEKLKQEKESNQLKIEKFDNASKSLDKLIGSQITDKKEFQQPEFEGYGPKTSKSVSKDISNKVRESPAALLVEELVSDDNTINYKEALSNKNNINIAKGKFYTARPKAVNTARPNSAVVNAIRSNQGHPQKKDQGYVDSGYSRYMTGNMSYLSKFKEFNRGYVTFGGGAKGGKITADESQVLLKVPRKNNMYSVDMKNIVPKECLICLVANATLDESMLWHRRIGKATQSLLSTWAFFLATKDEISSILKSFITKIENQVDKKVKIIRCDNGTEFKNRVMSKFDGKSDEGFFIGYLMNSKAIRVYNIRTRKVEENLHIRFLEDKPIIAGDGPKWLFDIDVLTKSMNYVPVVAGTNSNDLVGTEESIGAGHSRKRPKNSTQDVNTVGPSINTASTNVNTGSLNINTVSLIVTTAPLEATHADFFGDEIEVDMSNITTTYPVPSTPNIRIHKDHSLDHVIGKTQEDLHTCLFACFLSQEEPKKVWTLVDLPHGKRAIGTKWVYRNKKDERVARIKAIRLFLAYASFKYFVLYQMDVKSAFLYGKIEEEVYVYQPLGFEDPEFPDRVYKKDDGIFISQDKYVDEILKKFGFLTVKITSTPMETSKPLMKDENAKDVDVYLYRLMIGSLMYLTSSRPDIMFVVCACARFQVTPKVSHLHAMKRIFRYLTGQPKLGLWYPKNSPFNLKAFTDSDYAGASLDRKSTTGGCQFLGSRLI
ncbi:retrovirus-related pol polyprotein from transposon TNT 1-94 [Tanacetum coccineum]